MVNRHNLALVLVKHGRRRALATLSDIDHGVNAGDLTGRAFLRKEVEPLDFRCVRMNMREAVSQGPQVAVLEDERYEVPTS